MKLEINKKRKAIKKKKKQKQNTKNKQPKVCGKIPKGFVMPKLDMLGPINSEIWGVLGGWFKKRQKKKTETTKMTKKKFLQRKDDHECVYVSVCVYVCICLGRTYILDDGFDVGREGESQDDPMVFYLGNFQKNRIAIS